MGEEKKTRVEIVADYRAISRTPFIGCTGEITKGTVETGALVMLDRTDKNLKKIVVETRNYNTRTPIAFTRKELKEIEENETGGDT